MSAICYGTGNLGNLSSLEFGRLNARKQGTEMRDFSKPDKIVAGILPGDLLVRPQRSRQSA